jgi:hypothetical protein
MECWGKSLSHLLMDVNVGNKFLFVSFTTWLSNGFSDFGEIWQTRSTPNNSHISLFILFSIGKDLQGWKFYLKVLLWNLELWKYVLSRTGKVMIRVIRVTHIRVMRAHVISINVVDFITDINIIRTFPPLFMSL